jgi:hypothetical protein
MTVTALAERRETSIDTRAIESVLIQGDLSKLTPEQRVSYYNHLCESLGLNPLTKPFAYLTLNGKLVLYALKDAAEQLRKVHGVSITEVTSQKVEDVFVVTAKALDKTGRTDASTGAVALGSLKGEALANALMKAETKAKRRVTLSICGLGMLDETEVETIPHPVIVEAPKRVALPSGTVQIVSVQVTTWGGDITVVDEHGVETVHKTTERKVAELCEQIAQEGVPVTLTLTPITRGVNAGKEKLTAVKRYAPEDPIPVTAEKSGPPDVPVLTADEIPF